jgi:hypothetical protein
VHRILDAHRSALPAEGHRSEEDTVWLLALGRMRDDFVTLAA